jgi:peptidoglycan hydrolase-like protein with peptidoglycan-binding domain
MIAMARTANWSKKLVALVTILAVSACLSFAASQSKTNTTTHKTSKTSKSAHKSRKKSHKTRGQQAIDSERCREIQEALAREHYLSGQPSGKWDDSTQAAMRRYQADQGWQNKSVPDSRALIRLGLGPDHEHLLNPETAMTSQPQLPAGQGSRSSVSASRATATQSGSATQPNLPGAAVSAAPVSSTPGVSPAR